MARRLGELLVAKGKLSGDQLQKALQAQMIWGGHLGTNLIELGYVTEDELGEVLAEAHAVRYAPYEMLQEIPASVLASIPRGLVEKYKIVPFRFDGKRLHLVMLTPQDLTALDEVSFATGFQLVPYVTPEIRLFQILEKYFSIPRTKRYITLSREMGQRGRDRSGGQRPAAIKSGDRPRPAPSILDAPRALGGASPAPAEGGAEPAVAASPAIAPSLSGEAEAPAPDTTPAAPAMDWNPRSAGARSRQERQDPVELVPEPVGEEDPQAARDRSLDRLLKAQTLEEVCSVLIEEAAGVLRRCAVFARSGEAFVSIAGLAASSTTWSIEGVTLPANTVNIEALFAEGRTYYIGPAPGGPWEATYYDRFGGGTPRNLFLAPIRLNDRIALVFYGDQGEEELRPRDVDSLLALFQQAGLALDLLALRRKDSPA